jgi:type I restriction enzyme, R subunit
MHDYTEDALVEQPAIALLKSIGWQHHNAFTETFGADGSLGRETEGEVVFTQRLRAALTKLNPTVSADALEQTIEQITRDRSAMSPATANRDVSSLLKNNIIVRVRDASSPGGS